MSALTTENIRQPFSYYAFISYSRKDEKWARWLQNRLETYRLPAAIRKSNVDLPHKIAPIFRDKTDLSGTVLEDALYRELEASKFLIVICSPNSVASDYVNKEIAHFLALGREKLIIPFIVDGEPFAQDKAQECFPEALREMETELLGISVSELGRNNAFLRLVSTLLNLKYDQVVMRDTRRRIRRNILITASAVVLTVALGITVWRNIPHAKYYNAYIYRNGLPEGIYELSASERRNASDCYRITTRLGEVIKLECVDPAGNPADFILESVISDYPVQEFECDKSGRLISANQRDVYGALVATKVYSYRESSNEVAVDFQLPGDYHAYAMSADMSYVSIGSSDSDNKSEITRQINTYDENGLLIRTMYQVGNLGTPACDSNGVYGKLYDHDALGQIIRVTNLDADGNVHNCRYGWASVEYEYDERGNIIRESWYDAAGNPARNEKGAYSGKCAYDEYNNLISFLFLDENGQPYYCKDGYAEQQVSYDEAHYLLGVRNYDAQGIPVYCQDGYHELVFDYDDNHGLIGYTFYDADGERMYIQSVSCAGMRSIKDEAGRIKEYRFLDAQGQATCHIYSGAYGFRYEYDEHGYQCAMYYVDEQGMPTMTKYGYASCHDQNDAHGNSLRTEYRDENGELIRSKENLAVVERTYDTFGNWTGTRFYDENGAPCYGVYGYAGAEYAYENGNMISERFVDADGQPMMGPDQYWECRMEYDEKGNCTRWSYYDTAGSLSRHPSGFAILEKEYDDYGHVVKERYYDEESAQCAPNGFTEVSFEYDARGNCILESYTAASKTSLRFDYVTFEYDAHDNRIRESYHKKDGSLIGGTYFYPSAYLWTYDERGNTTSVCRLGEDGLPLYHDGNMANTEKYVYDERGNLVLEQYIHTDAAGNETVNYQYAYAYDSFGNIIRKDHLDGDGNLSNETNGDSASHLYTYDARGNVIQELRYDEDGNPSASYHRIETVYDALGNELLTRYYDSEGNLIEETAYD